MANKATVASSLIKTLKLCGLPKVIDSFDMGICCSKCAVEPPEGPKGEYYLLGHTPVIADGIRLCGHKPCKRDWILCKERGSDIWFRVRPIYDTAANESLCPYAQYDGPYAGKKCPSGELCVLAHSRVELRVWTIMKEVGLNFDSMREVLLEEIANYFLSSKKAVNPKDGVDSSHDSPSATAVPEDAVRPGSVYEKQGIFLCPSNKTYLIIHITHVDSPDQIYFQLCEAVQQVEDCWKDMNVFYESEEGGKYKMVDEDLLRNLPVAVKLWDGEQKSFSWRRAKIVECSLGASCQVKVVDVDFGGVSTINLESLRLLRRKYFGYHSQAIEGAIAYIRPPGDTWSVEAVETVRSFAAKCPLVAEVVGTTMPGDKYALEVCDTSKPDLDCFLADVLTKSEHAVACASSVKPFAYVAGGTVGKLTDREAGNR